MNLPTKHYRLQFMVGQVEIFIIRGGFGVLHPAGGALDSSVRAGDGAVLSPDDDFIS
jgi:hypothetical protein